MKTQAEKIDAATVQEERHLFLVAAAQHHKIGIGKDLAAAIIASGSISGVDAFEINYERLPADIHKWALKWRIDFPWVCEVAFTAVQAAFWGARSASLPRDLDFSFNPGWRHSPVFDWRSGLAPYDPREDAAEYERQAMAAFKKALRAYMASVKECGGRLRDARGSQSKYFRWAAERVCLDWGWITIITNHQGPEGPDAPRRAVPPILERIGILLPTETV